MSCIFFLSYARKNFDLYLEKFYNDLVKSVSDLTGEDDVGFRDVQNLEGGAEWGPGLAEALQNCRVFVPLYSSHYFKREFCGKEWQFFRNRLKAYNPAKPPPLMLPVRWIETKLPPVVDEIHINPYGLDPEEYKTDGVRDLIKANPKAYDEFLSALSRNIRDLWETPEYNIPPLPSTSNLKDVDAAFARPEKPRNLSAGVTNPSDTSEPLGPSHARFVYVVGKRSDVETCWKDRKHFDSHGSSFWEWRPFLPPEDRRITVLMQNALATQDLRELTWVHNRAVTPNQLIDELKKYEKLMNIVVILVDSWTLANDQFGTVLEELDGRRFKNCTLLVPWNDTDEDIKTHETRLMELLRRVLFSQRDNLPFLKPADFTEKLQKALIHVQHEIFDYLKVQRPVAGAGPSTVPGVSTTAG
jgi:FxsC-like protein